MLGSSIGNQGVYQRNLASQIRKLLVWFLSCVDICELDRGENEVRLERSLLMSLAQLITFSISPPPFLFLVLASLLIWVKQWCQKWVFCQERRDQTRKSKKSESKRTTLQHINGASSGKYELVSGKAKKRGE